MDAAFSPTRISFENLVLGDANESLRNALQEVGMVAITDIPSFGSKLESLQLLPECVEESKEEALEHTFSDGTRRLTLATHAAGTSSSSQLKVAEHEKCAEFQESSQAFRMIVGRVIESFAEGLASAFHLDASKPLLFDETNQGYSLLSIFQEGEQLEHFHTYYSGQNSQGEETLEWHTDQGLALAFTPGLVNGKPTEGFFVKLSDGSTEMVDFKATDDLVFLLGDGVNQYVNAVLDPEDSLRALPHALRMPSANSARVWYGRMVLPPSKAIHPAHSVTFGEIRNGMIAEDVVSSTMGCSHNLVARELSETTCEEGTASWCWHRCMNYTDYDASPTICSDQDLDLACINDDGALWVGDHNPAFKIGCIDLATATNFTVTDDSEGQSDQNHGDSSHGDDGHTNGDEEKAGDEDDGDEDSAVPASIFGSAVLGAITLLAL